MIEFVVYDTCFARLRALESDIHSYFGAKEHNLFAFDSASALLSYLEGVRGLVSVAFLELEPDEGDGLETVRTVAERYPAIRIVAMSEDARRMEELFLCRPAFFLFEPVSAPSLERCLGYILESIQRTQYRFLSITNRNCIVNILYDDIAYMESDRRVVTIYEEQESHVFYEKLDTLETRLGLPFLRCHKSFLVNMDKIRIVTPDAIQLTDGREVPVSQNKYAQVRKAFVQYVTDRSH